MKAAIEDFERALIGFQNSVTTNLSAEDVMLVNQSVQALRVAKTRWFNTNKETDDLLVFRRATDEVLRANHIQRLCTHQRLGVFGGRVESAELQQLRLSLRGLRDFSMKRSRASTDLQVKKELLWNVLQGMYLGGFLLFSLISLISLNLTCLFVLPLIGLIFTVCYYETQLIMFLVDTIMSGVNFEFSFDLWNASVEAYRELFTDHSLPVLGSVVAISAFYGLLAGSFYAGASVLTLAGSVFIGMSLIHIASLIPVFLTFIVISTGYHAALYVGEKISEYMLDLNQWFHGIEPLQPDGVEGFIEPERQDEEEMVLGLA